MPIITICCWDGCEAEAETPEGALLAARTLWDEAIWYSIPAGVTTGYPVVSFFVDGELVRLCTNRSELN
jgi:hypothetical protein